MQFLIDLCCFRVVSPAEYTFMGSLIIREVIKDLVPKGIKQAKVIMLAGTRSVTSSQCLINNMSDDTLTKNWEKLTLKRAYCRYF